ncbi:SSI family serine proteinase inhibitor [Streptomyces sasae]|uniref:SSI family serine proteinase inhibitor n=1 Tax=Streptomyces sasae TaxID=1266772 RepID=UPI00292FCB73|nr:SSI family serine proteinase inhibitor [Streptomyces sasae]
MSRLPSQVRSRSARSRQGWSRPAVRGALGGVTAVLGAFPVLPAPPASAAAVRADHLTVTVQHAGDGRDGTYELSCHPGAGSHPDVAGACRTLDRNTNWGRETFAPVAPGTACTMLYGGPATAHVTGDWAGRPVDATYDRSNGCEIGRWDRMVPLLPALRS